MPNFSYKFIIEPFSLLYRLQNIVHTLTWERSFYFWTRAFFFTFTGFLSWFNVAFKLNIYKFTKLNHPTPFLLPSSQKRVRYKISSVQLSQVLALSHNLQRCLLSWKFLNIHFPATVIISAREIFPPKAKSKDCSWNCKTEYSDTTECDSCNGGITETGLGGTAKIGRCRRDARRCEGGCSLEKLFYFG